MSNHKKTHKPRSIAIISAKIGAVKEDVLDRMTWRGSLNSALQNCAEINAQQKEKVLRCSFSLKYALAAIFLETH